MKKIIMSLAAITTLTLAGGNISEVVAIEETPEIVVPFTGAYLGAGLTFAQTYIDGYSNWFSDDLTAETGTGFNVIGGYQFFNDGEFAVSAEARYGSTFTGYDVGFDDYYSNGDLETYAAFVKAAYQIEEFGMYGLLGYGESSVNFIGNTVLGLTDTFSISNDDIAYGAGVEYSFTPNVVAWADYVVYPQFDIADDVEPIDNDVITIGVSYRFGL